MSVDQWRTMVDEELARLNCPLPQSLVIAVMERESRGRVGAKNPTSGASGLMQVMPIALKHYNENHSKKYNMADLRAKTDNAGRIQIRVGLWILVFFVKAAYRYLKKFMAVVPLNELIRTADFFYASGGKRARDRLNLVTPPPTFDNVKSKFPGWDRLAPAQLVWDRSVIGPWNIPAIDAWLEGNIEEEDERTGLGAALGIIIIAIAWWYFEKGKAK